MRDRRVGVDPGSGHLLGCSRPVVAGGEAFDDRAFYFGQGATLYRRWRWRDLATGQALAQFRSTR